MGGSTGSRTTGAGSAEGRTGEEDVAGEGVAGEVVFFFLLKKPILWKCRCGRDVGCSINESRGRMNGRL